MTEIVNHPINKDERSWWDKLIGEPYIPLYHVNGIDCLHAVDQMNRQNIDKWHCKIGRVIFGRPDDRHSGSL